MNDLGAWWSSYKLFTELPLSWPSVLSPHAGLLLFFSPMKALLLSPYRPYAHPPTEAQRQDFSFSDALELNGFFGSCRTAPIALPQPASVLYHSLLLERLDVHDGVRRRRKTTPQNQNESQKSICCPSWHFSRMVDAGWPADLLDDLAFDDEKRKQVQAKARNSSLSASPHLTAPRSQPAKPSHSSFADPILQCTPAPGAPFK